MGGLLTSNEQISKVIKSPPAQNTWLEIKTAFTKFYPKSRTEVAFNVISSSFSQRDTRLSLKMWHLVWNRPCPPEKERGCLWRFHFILYNRSIQERQLCFSGEGGVEFLSGTCIIPSQDTGTPSLEMEPSLDVSRLGFFHVWFSVLLEATCRGQKGRGGKAISGQSN